MTALIPLDQPLLFNLALLFWGFICLFLGYRLFRLFLALSGVYFGFYLSSRYFPDLKSPTQIFMILLSTFITSSIAFSLYSLTFTLLGGAAGLMFGLSVVPLIDLTPAGTILGLIMTTLLGAIFGSVLKEIVVVLATAFGGAHLILIALTSLAATSQFSVYFLTLPVIHLGLLLTLTLIGYISQTSQAS